MLAIIKVLLKWEDKLLRFKFSIVTDHEALGYLKMQCKLSSRQVWWVDYMSRFNATIVYIKGTENWVVDCLSRYYEDRGGKIAPEEDVEWGNADAWSDPERDDLPHDRWQELCLSAMSTQGKHPRQPERVLDDPREGRRVEAEEMAAHAERSKEDNPIKGLKDNPSLLKSVDNSPDLPGQLQDNEGLQKAITTGYKTDPVLLKVWSSPEHHATFWLKDNLLYTNNHGGEEVLCVPQTKVKGDMIDTKVIAQAHQMLGHLGAQQTADYIHRWYWWPKLGQEVDKYCHSCPTCQVIKTDNQRPLGLLHSLPIPTQPWRLIAMDFMGPFPPSNEHNYMWVMLCRLMSMVHLIPVEITIRASQLAGLYIQEIVWLHRLPDMIISDRDTKFTLTFWQEIHQMLEAKLLMSTAFHPQTDGASKHSIHTMAQILQAIVQPNQHDWVEKVPMVKYAINLSISSSMGFMPFELNYGHIPIMMSQVDKGITLLPLGWRHLYNRCSITWQWHTTP